MAAAGLAAGRAAAAGRVAEASAAVAVMAEAAAARAVAGLREAGRPMTADELSTEDARSRIAQAIAEAERDTSGEIVVVIAPRCDDYAFVPLAWAAIIALAVPPMLYAFFWLSPVTIYGIAVATFAMLAMLLGMWPVRLAVTPRALRRKHARRCAREQFLTQELHTTQSRTGVLIFVALAE